MGWRDRDYAKFTDAELADYLGTTYERKIDVPTAREAALPPRRSIFARGVGPAVTVSALLYGLGHFPPGHPLLSLPRLFGSAPARTAPTPSVAPPTFARPRTPGRIDGLTTGRVGGSLTLSGTVGAATSGAVAVDGSYDGGATWYRLATAPVSQGSYSARLQLLRVGVLRLRVSRPDGSTAEGDITVTP